MKQYHILVTLLLFSITVGYAQNGELYIPTNIQKAYNKKTRSEDGNPGMVYWQNRADYKINVKLDPKTLVIKGTETITYFNNSSDTLKELFFHLFPNMYKKGNYRDFEIDPSDESDGVSIDKMDINGFEINTSFQNRRLTYTHSGLSLRLKNPIYPGSSNKINISWSYTENRRSHIRAGMVDSTSFFIAYFFPRLAVYDDIDGWNRFDYTGGVEFYNDFGDFDVSITVPKNFVVWATGILKNPEEVLNEKYFKRYQAAINSNIVVRVIDTSDIRKRDFTKPNDFNTWKYKADFVTDFAFGTSDHYLWDAVSLLADKEKNKKILIDVAYNQNSKDFYENIKFAQQAITYMCNVFPGIPFPYPKITVFNGLSEMEYPMMVNNISYVQDIHGTFLLTAHEIFHTYYPFYTGLNETSYAWMDEGITTFSTYLLVNALDSLNEDKLTFLNDYKPYRGKNSDLPIFSNSNYIKRPVYDFISYPKPTHFFLVLRNHLGEKMFTKSFQDFIKRWKGKHPTPYDLFNTFKNVTGENLDWLIKPWIFEFGYVDFSIKEVIQSEGKFKVTIEKIGNYPAHVKIKVKYNTGSSEILRYPASIWKDNKKEYSAEKNDSRKVVEVEIYDLHNMDVNSSNNVFKVNARRKQ
jgi:hypothetical protein